MICFPNAKINIGLHITEERPDGYHNIESIFYPIPLVDALEAVFSKKTSFTQTGLPLETAPEDNLVMKAYDLMDRKYKLPALDIFLKKAIPSGAGLGGGSADAAFMLKLLFSHPTTTKLSGLPLCDWIASQARNDGEQVSSLRGGTTKQSGIDDYGRLLEMAESIGADCPFFIRNTPAIVTGTGNVFQVSDISLKGYTIYIVKPPVSISTKEAYSMIKPQKPVFSLNKLSAIPVHEWKYVVKNDFEPGMFKKYPLIKEIKEHLYSMGAEYASMSGSGSAVYGLFKNNALSPISPFPPFQPFPPFPPLPPFQPFSPFPPFQPFFSWKGILE